VRPEAVEKSLDLGPGVRRQAVGEGHRIEARANERGGVGQNAHEAREAAQHLREAGEGQDGREGDDDRVLSHAGCDLGKDGREGGRVKCQENTLAGSPFTAVVAIAGKRGRSFESTSALASLTVTRSSARPRPPRA
jgi:hypothetical protein